MLTYAERLRINTRNLASYKDKKDLKLIFCFDID